MVGLGYSWEEEITSFDERSVAGVKGLHLRVWGASFTGAKVLPVGAQLPVALGRCYLLGFSYLQLYTSLKCIDLPVFWCHSSHVIESQWSHVFSFGYCQGLAKVCRRGEPWNNRAFTCAGRPFPEVGESEPWCELTDANTLTYKVLRHLSAESYLNPGVSCQCARPTRLRSSPAAPAPPSGTGWRYEGEKAKWGQVC